MRTVAEALNDVLILTRNYAPLMATEDRTRWDTLAAEAATLGVTLPALEPNPLPAWKQAVASRVQAAGAAPDATDLLIMSHGQDCTCACCEAARAGYVPSE